MQATILAAAIALALFCFPRPGHSQDQAPAARLTPVFTDGVVHPQIRGSWRARGYGYVFSFTERRAELLSMSSVGAWMHPAADDLDMYFQADGSGQRVRITPHVRVPGYRLERIEALPLVRPAAEWNQVDVFDALAATMAEFYPFFEVRKIDWPARVRALRPRLDAKMTDADLFSVCGELLSGLNDGHVSLRAEIDGVSHSVRSNGEDTYSRLRAAFEAQDTTPDYSTFRRAWVARFKAQLEDDLLDGNAQFACERRLVWGRVGEDVGYLFITGMGGFAAGGLDAQVRALHRELGQILDALADTRALIVDVSLNRGGMDLFSIEIASHFADRRRLGFSKYPARAPEYRQDRFIEPYRDGQGRPKAYTKPVYLVINSVTASAAEIFAMCMRALPNVRTVGKPTAGALSDVLEKPLPNGWEFGMSNEIYLDHEGECYEGLGIPPAVGRAIFDEQDIGRVGHAKAIREIAERARRAR